MPPQIRPPIKPATDGTCICIVNVRKCHIQMENRRTCRNLNFGPVKIIYQPLMVDIQLLPT